MIRPWNCRSRLPESLATEARSTVKAAALTVVPATVIEPVTLSVRPTAVVS